MTENKRYTDYEDENYWNVIKDLKTGRVYDDAGQIADLLNRLWNAHERCRDTNEALHKDFDKLWRICKGAGLTEEEIIMEMDK